MSFGVGLRVEFAGEVSTVLAYRSSNYSTVKDKNEIHTPAFVPSTASADAPDIVRYRFDTIRIGANALRPELIFSSIAAAKEGAGAGTGVAGGCRGRDVAGVTGLRDTFDFFNFEDAVTTLESES